MEPSQTDHAELIRARIAHHGVQIGSGEDRVVVALARRWLESAVRLRSVAETLEPSVGPAIISSPPTAAEDRSGLGGWS